jgi:hypothetical protein
MIFRAAAVFLALLVPDFALAQAPPPPKPGQPSIPQPGVSLTLKPTEGVVTAYLTGLGALKYCDFGGKELLDGVRQGFGLRPDTIDPALGKRIVDGVEAEVKQNKERFCERAWRNYGAHGVDFEGLLTVPGAAKAAGWNIEPMPAGGPVVYCHAYRHPDRSTTAYFLRREDGLQFLVASSKLKLKMSEAYSVVVEIGSVTRRLTGESMNPDRIRFVLAKDLLDLLQRNEAFTLRVQDETFAVPFKGSAEILDKLDACLKANASRAAR